MLSGPWRNLPIPQVDAVIVSPEGEVRANVRAYWSESIIIEDVSIDVKEGDEIRRQLPNGNDEVFIIDDPKCNVGGIFTDHYRLKISRKKNYPHGQGGHYSVTISGHNSSVNIGLGNTSTNISHGDVYSQIERALSDDKANQEAVAELKVLLREIKMAQTQPERLSAYQRFIAKAANHMVILTPFLPQLTALLTQI